MFGTFYKNLYNLGGITLRRAFSGEATSAFKDLEYLQVSALEGAPKVALVRLNRPTKRNALNFPFALEIERVFNSLNEEPTCRAILLQGSTENQQVFCSGIDIAMFGKLANDLLAIKDTGRRALKIGKTIHAYQQAITAIEQCSKPVVAAVRGGCIGIGLELISAVDIRFASEDSWFAAREVNMAVTGDMGLLQRMPKLVGNQSTIRELCLTGRRFSAHEAHELGLIGRVVENGDLEHVAKQTVAAIAAQSPLATQGTKRALVYARDHSVSESLEWVRLWNQAMLQSEDLLRAVATSNENKTAEFGDA